jgi:2-C-methyl-D-erythritol 2,4-cyclodiphosphate synthase
MSNLRIGLGTDTHRLVEKRKLILGGIEIPHFKGCQGHSDGDALIHAFCDALLGAANLRDIGYHFPDKDNTNKDRNSEEFLFEVNSMLQKLNFELINTDITIQIQKPKINPHIPKMQKRLADILSTDINNISIKAKTGEGIGIIGREEAVSVQCIVMIEKSN